MGTEAKVYFDSRITIGDLPHMPGRLVQTAKFREFFEMWGWDVDASQFEWSGPPGVIIPGVRVDEYGYKRPNTVTLFGPGGHLCFGPGWLEWSSEVKWSWFLNRAEGRAALIDTADTIASLIGAHLALIAPDGGSEYRISDTLESGGDIQKAFEILKRQYPPVLSAREARIFGANERSPDYFFMRFE